MLVGPSMLCYVDFSIDSIFLAGILVLLNSHLKSSNCLTYVDFSTATRYVISGAHKKRMGRSMKHPRKQILCALHIIMMLL